MSLRLRLNGGEVEEKVCELPYEKVKVEHNHKIMIGCERVASGEANALGEFEVFQSANRNVISIKVGGYFHHVILEDIIAAVCKNEGPVTL